jgi:hypothetical protein
MNTVHLHHPSDLPDVFADRLSLCPEVSNTADVESYGVHFLIRWPMAYLKMKSDILPLRQSSTAVGKFSYQQPQIYAPNARKGRPEDTAVGEFYVGQHE